MQGSVRIEAIGIDSGPAHALLARKQALEISAALRVRVSDALVGFVVSARDASASTARCRFICKFDSAADAQRCVATLAQLGARTASGQHKSPDSGAASDVKPFARPAQALARAGRGAPALKCAPPSLTMHDESLSQANTQGPPSSQHAAFSSTQTQWLAGSTQPATGAQQSQVVVDVDEYALKYERMAQLARFFRSATFEADVRAADKLLQAFLASDKAAQRAFDKLVGVCGQQADDDDLDID